MYFFLLFLSSPCKERVDKEVAPTCMQDGSASAFLQDSRLIGQHNERRLSFPNQTRGASLSLRPDSARLSVPVRVRVRLGTGGVKNGSTAELMVGMF